MKNKIFIYIIMFLFNFSLCMYIMNIQSSNVDLKDSNTYSAFITISSEEKHIGLEFNLKRQKCDYLNDTYSSKFSTYALFPPNDYLYALDFYNYKKTTREELETFVKDVCIPKLGLTNVESINIPYYHAVYD